MTFHTETLDLDNLAADPVSLDDGQFWYNNTLGVPKVRAAGVSRPLIWDGQEIYFVGKHGDDTNNGLSPETAFLTFGAAVAAAAAGDAIVCWDAGVYVENVVLPSGVDLYAPNATLQSAGATATLTVDFDSEVTLNTIIQDQAGLSCITKTANAGTVRCDINVIDLVSGTVAMINLAFAATTAVLLVKVNSLFVRSVGGFGVGDITNAGHMHVEAEDIYLAGNNTTGILRSLAGSTVCRVGHILELGAPTGTVGINCAGGRIDILVLNLAADTAWNVGAAGTLKGFAAEVSGAKVETGTVAVVEPGVTSEVWNRTGAGAVHPTTVTDDVVIGATATVGAERLRVVGDARVEGKLTVTGLIDPTGLLLDGQAAAPTAPGANTGLIWVDDSVSPTVLKYTDDTPTDFALWQRNPNVVLVASEGGDYTTIGAAMAAITTAAPANPFVILVEPGVYTEAPITVKSYVLVIGRERAATVISASDPNNPLFTMSANSGLREIHILVGPANDDCIYVNTGTGGVFCAGILAAAGLNGFHVNGAGTSAMLMDSFFRSGLTGSGVLATSGATAACDLSFMAATTGVYANGGTVKLNTLNIQDCTTGMLADNGGTLNFSNISIVDCTTCVETGATGTNEIKGHGVACQGVSTNHIVQGAASGVIEANASEIDETKITTVDDSNVLLAFNDSVAKTFRITEDLSVGQFQGGPTFKVLNGASPVRVFPESRTYTSAPGSMIFLPNTTTLTYNYAGGSIAGMNLQGTMVLNFSAAPLNHYLLFNNGMLFKNANGVVANMGPGQTFIAQPRLQADGAAIVMSMNRDFLSQPNYQTINGGTLTVNAWNQVQLIGAINAGVTMAYRRGVGIYTLTSVAGTLNEHTGIYIQDLQVGAVSTQGIYSLMNTGASKLFIRHDGTAASKFGGAIQLSAGAAAADWQLSRLVANIATLADGDSLRISTGNLFFGGSGSVALSEGAANRLDLASGDSFRIVSGSLQFAGTAEQISRSAGELLLTAASVRTSAELEVDGDLNHDGSNVGFYGVAPVAQAAAYTVTNPVTRRSFDTTTVTLQQLAEVVGTVIGDLQALGLVG